jgi:alkane 1-monooxygenase
MYWRFFIPIILCLCFVLLAELGYFYLVFIVLFTGNIFNVLWGEFSGKEIKKELAQFYSTTQGKIIKRLSSLLLILFFGWGLRHVISHDVSLLYLIAFSMVFGLFIGCFSITLAHDLLHSNQKTDVYLASLLLLLSNIPHLAIDHVYGHHRTIGLKKDTTTAKVNQSFYDYFLKISYSRVYEVFINGYDLPAWATKRIFKLGRRMLIIQLIVWAFLLFAFPEGRSAFLFFLIQGFMAYMLYELINYIQHYGLVRKSEKSPITQAHSWNCYYKYTNYILYMLPLHSLHHLPKSERQKALNDLKAGPKMPYLYFVMISIAMIPPLWFKIINKRILDKTYEL